MDISDLVNLEAFCTRPRPFVNFPKPEPASEPRFNLSELLAITFEELKVRNWVCDHSVYDYKLFWRASVKSNTWLPQWKR
jgi:hypothetical protein